ncbi:MAG: hypothetical protein AAB309_01070 [Deltaproteobacteria bacterium]
MKTFVLLFLSLVSFALPRQLVAQPPPRECIRLLARLIREGNSGTLRKEMLGVATSRLWTDKLAESFKCKISRFLDETFDSLTVHLPHEEANWRSYLANRLNLSFSDSEYQEIASLIRMTKGERTELFRSAVPPMITSWRSHFRASINGVFKWKNTEENFLTDQFSDYTEYIGWTHELEATSLRFKMIRFSDGMQYALFLEPGSQLSFDRLPTHLQIGQTSQVFDVVYVQSKYGFKGVVDSFSLLPSKHRFVTLSFIRRETASMDNIFVSEKFSEVIVDLTSGRVYSGWHGKPGWLEMMQGPMTDLFRQEVVRFRSPLSKLLLTTLENLKREGGYNIDNFVEKELTLIEDGIFCYRLGRFNFETGSFENHSPVITFIINMKNLSKPRMIESHLKP